MSFSTVVPERVAHFSPSSSLSLSFFLRCSYVRWLISIAVKGFRQIGGVVREIACGIAGDSAGGGTIGTCGAAIAGEDTGIAVADVAHGTADTDRSASLEAGVSAGVDSVTTNDSLLCAVVSERTLGAGDDDREARLDLLGIRRCSRAHRESSPIALSNSGLSFDVGASVYRGRCGEIQSGASSSQAHGTGQILVVRETPRIRITWFRQPFIGLHN